MAASTNTSSSLVTLVKKAKENPTSFIEKQVKLVLTDPYFQVFLKEYLKANEIPPIRVTAARLKHTINSLSKLDLNPDTEPIGFVLRCAWTKARDSSFGAYALMRMLDIPTVTKFEDVETIFKSPTIVRRTSDLPMEDGIYCCKWVGLYNHYFLIQITDGKMIYAFSHKLSNFIRFKTFNFRKWKKHFTTATEYDNYLGYMDAFLITRFDTDHLVHPTVAHSTYFDHLKVVKLDI